VLLNLIINAEHAMVDAHARGVLHVTTRHDADRDTVVIEVGDDGPGVPSAIRGRIFDPFFTTKEVGKGTGLGLTVAYAIIQEHGGRITVKSRPGEGASFFVSLPVTDGPVKPAMPNEPITTAIGGGAVVLVVEDEAALGAAVAESLVDAGFAVDRAGDGEEALARVKSRAYDLIICDLKMPRVDGMAFYRALEREQPAAARRILFVTGDVAGTEAEQFLEETGCRWLAKPFRLRDLLRTSREILG